MIHQKHVGEAVAGAEARVANDLSRGRCCCRRTCGDRVRLARQQVDGLNHIEPCSCRREAGNPVNPEHPPTARWEWQRMEETTGATVFRLRVSAGLTRAHVLSDIAVLAHPEGRVAPASQGVMVT